MKTIFVFVGLVLLATGLGAKHEEPRPNGVIYGTVIGPDGQPAKAIGLTAHPLGVALAAVLPRTGTNEKGEYRFQNVPWWGRYTVYAEDEDKGYSSFSTGPSGDTNPPEVAITPEHREAELNVQLPPRAGFVQIRLTNRRTGDAISAMRIVLMPLEKPDSPLFRMSCYSNHVVLVPPDKNLLLHVTSDGFREWDESVEGGKPLNLPSGTRLTLSVQLDPAD